MVKVVKAVDCGQIHIKFNIEDKDEISGFLEFLRSAPCDNPKHVHAIIYQELRDIMANVAIINSIPDIMKPKYNQRMRRHETRELVSEYVIYTFREINNVMWLEAAAAINGKTYFARCPAFDTKHNKHSLLRCIAYAYAEDNNIDDGVTLRGGGE